MTLRPYEQNIVADTEAEILGMVPLPGQVGYPLDTRIRMFYTGTAWVPTTAVQILRYQTTVNATTTGNTTIYTIPAATSFKFIPLGAHVEVVSTSGTGILAPSISVGTNSPNYNNMFTSTSLVSLLNALLGTTAPNALTISANVTPLAGGTAIIARVNSSATGYTTYTLGIDVLGYYRP